MLSTSEEKEASSKLSLTCSVVFHEKYLPPGQPDFSHLSPLQIFNQYQNQDFDFQYAGIPADDDGDGDDDGDDGK